MKYSFIIPYRDREDNLRALLSKLLPGLVGVDYEIIVAEQGDPISFCRANMFNEGARIATGDVFIFHDVDHVAQDTNLYFNQPTDVWLPMRASDFVMNDFSPRPPEDIPQGYRHFKNAVDENFFGGVLCIKREAFYKINGWNTEYRGWGMEEADFRERCIRAKLSIGRSAEGRFWELYHEHVGLPGSDPRLQHNLILFHNRDQYLDKGINNSYKPTIVETQPRIEGITKWIVVWYINDPKKSHIVFTRLD